MHACRTLLTNLSWLHPEANATMYHMCLCVVLMMANILVSILATRAERCVSEPSTRHLSARRPIRSGTVILGLQPGCISELLLLPSPSYRCYLSCVTLRHQIAEPCVWLVASARVCACVCVHHFECLHLFISWMPLRYVSLSVAAAPSAPRLPGCNKHNCKLTMSVCIFFVCVFVFCTMLCCKAYVGIHTLCYFVKFLSCLFLSIRVAGLLSSFLRDVRNADVAPKRFLIHHKILLLPLSHLPIQIWNNFGFALYLIP